MKRPIEVEIVEDVEIVKSPCINPAWELAKHVISYAIWTILAVIGFMQLSAVLDELTM